MLTVCCHCVSFMLFFSGLQCMLCMLFDLCCLKDILCVWIWIFAWNTQPRQRKQQSWTNWLIVRTFLSFRWSKSEYKMFNPQITTGNRRYWRTLFKLVRPATSFSIRLRIFWFYKGKTFLLYLLTRRSVSLVASCFNDSPSTDTVFFWFRRQLSI